MYLDVMYSNFNVMISQEIIKGLIKPLIIKLINENGKMYGYQITQQVKESSKGKLLITEGALYPALHKLVDEGILTVETVLTKNRERKYYSLSKYGAESAPTKLDEIRQSILVLFDLFEIKPV